MHKSVKILVACLWFLTLAHIEDVDVPYFANGAKVGEVDQDSAIVWVRLTRNPKADFSGLAIFVEGLDLKQRDELEMPIGVVPGIHGQVRIRYWLQGHEQSKRESKWFEVRKASDFTYQFKLEGLEAGRKYEFDVHGRLHSQSVKWSSLHGRFRTAPDSNQSRPIRFAVSTCQAIRSIDSGKDGHRAYRQMANLAPDFFVHTGDILYYDKAPLCKNAVAARAKWNLMFAYKYNRTLCQNISCYFMKDDHDTLKNDCWPGQTYGELTFDQGLAIFREQVCMGAKTYRSVRWGKDLQIWLTENRDFRSSNRMKDGPDKTILGKQQKQWLFETIEASDATFKFVISPGPIVGPDKNGKQDNHSNAGFQTEGQQLREFIAKQENTYVICGDRHWQYCSQDPKTGVVEFGCGPINDEHRFGGNPGVKPEYHRYFGAKGGFLLVSINGDSGKADWYHANAKENRPQILHSENIPIRN